MTAEVAILNKSAVALAADSAVTIGAAPNVKIYNTVNKIFELSAYHPIGIMIYGQLDFMGLPLETIIKQYRKRIGTKSFATIADACVDFRSHLLSEIHSSVDDDQKNIYLLTYSTFSKANSAIDNLILEDVMKRGSYKKSKVNSIAQQYIKHQIAKLKSLPFASGFSRKAIPDQYKFAIDATIDRTFRSISPTDTTRKLIREYAGYCLAKETLSDYRTGIVIAGFGDEEICPSLAHFEMDGIIDTKLKIIERPYVDIGRNGPEADILGFAQDDMVKNFLNGIDPNIHRYFSDLYGKAISDTAGLIISSIINDSTREAAILSGLKPEIDKISSDVSSKADSYIKEVSDNPIRAMIRSMPKQELAILASSLIEITSLKRKVTRVQETVGGEVDVAIISKSEGFVWTKRKHYFPAELNRRFFVRNFGEK